MLHHAALLVFFFILIGIAVIWVIAKLIAQTPSRYSRTELGQVELIQILNLTPEQYKQIEANIIRNQPKIKQNQQMLQQVFEEFQILVEGFAANELIRIKHLQIQQLQQQMENKQFESMLAVRQILTKPQRQKLAELIKEQNFIFLPFYCDWIEE